MPSIPRFLASIKMSAICYALTTGEGADCIAQRFDIFEADIRMLQENVVRILMGFSAIVLAIDKSELDENLFKEKKHLVSYPSNMSSMLVNMTISSGTGKPWS